MNRLEYGNVLFFAVFLSFIKEIINIPLIEINQLMFLIAAIYCLSQYGQSFKLRKNSINIIAIIMLFVLVIQGGFLTQNIKNFANVYVDYFFCLSVFIICSQLKESEYNQLLRKICFSGTIIALLECILWRCNSRIYDLLFYRPFEELRNVASFLSPNSYAIIIAFLMLYHFHYFLNYHKVRYAMCFALLLLPLFTTYSKSGIFILALGIICELFLYNIFTRYVSIVVVLTSLYLVYTNKIVYILQLCNLNNNYYARRFIAYFESGNIFSGREAGYENLLNIIKNNFFIGVGFSNLTNNSELFLDFSTPHNEYLRFWAEIGIIGLILIGVFVIVSIIYIIRIYKLKTIYSNNWSLCITFAVMFLAAQLFYNYWGTPREGMLLSFFASGIFFRYSNKALNKRREVLV